MINGKKIVATIEARMTSTRLPGKVMLPLAGKPNLTRLIERLQRSRYVDDVVIATTTNATDGVLERLAKELGVGVWRGSEDDVLARVLGAAQSVQADLIVEVTGDCPLIDWRHVDHIAEIFATGEWDYVANNMLRTFPRGLDIQIFPTSVLAEVERVTQDPVDRENVSIYIYTHPERYRCYNWSAEGRMQRPDVRITLDTKEDYELINTIFERLLLQNPDFSAEEVISLLEHEPELMDINREVKQKNPYGGYLSQ